MLAQMSAGLENFAERYGIAINDPTLIRRYRMEMDAIRDEATRISVAEERGEERGKREIAKRMKENGESIDYIMDMTGLSVDDIESL